MTNWDPEVVPSTSKPWVGGKVDAALPNFSRLEQWIGAVGKGNGSQLTWKETQNTQNTLDKK